MMIYLWTILSPINYVKSLVTSLQYHLAPIQGTSEQIIYWSIYLLNLMTFLHITFLGKKQNCDRITWFSSAVFTVVIALSTFNVSYTLALKLNFKVHSWKENLYNLRVIRSSFQYRRHCSIYYVALVDALAKFAFSIRFEERESEREAALWCDLTWTSLSLM